ncbi:TetR/AcrR family transcriptional regulator [Actinomadura sp. WAC 06369]|uniref:TetR/AcrR family transcriptional regulator n=1 Tax=Actinomadura sp. WAC 06369 TaxID=2203193 RepID=UPI000F790299|nr:TetR family transcriptional regulator [Actinomadura sp. WAC 06369]RSN68956.1 TetR family transcriptional regulator [Actinomadura sp. WAC 06369]
MESLRERKKEATRRALHRAAIRLTVEHGLDNVTVEAIADAANVSRRTFSNYFAAKEDALLYGDGERMQSLLRIFESRPQAERSWPALRGSLHALMEEVGEPDPAWAAQARLARAHPSVLARQLARWADFERTLSSLIAERDALPPGSPRARILAGAFMTTLRIASLTWTDAHPPRPLAAVIDEHLDEMARTFT